MWPKSVATQHTKWPQTEPPGWLRVLLEPLPQEMVELLGKTELLLVKDLETASPASNTAPAVAEPRPSEVTSLALLGQHEPVDHSANPTRHMPPQGSAGHVPQGHQSQVGRDKGGGPVPIRG